MYLSGITDEKEICARTGTELKVVRAIIRRFSLAKKIQQRNLEITKSTLEFKSGMLREIAARSLGYVNDWLKELEDPDLRAKRLKTPKDIKDLATLAMNVNKLLRLELGQSTENVQHDVQLSLEQTKKMFDDLRGKDPVFDYPEIDGRADIITLPERTD